MFKFKYFYLFQLVLWSSLTLKANDIKLIFNSTNIKEAKLKAGQEGKLIFIDFYADWCMPCQWMDQTTFKDEEVTRVLSQHYISLKANIDEESGYDLKNAYDIKYLPTMLIFNSEGRLLDRVEQSLTPKKLVALLNKYNEPTNKVITKHNINTAPDLHHPRLADVSESMKSTNDDFNTHFNGKASAKTYRVQIGVFERYQGAQEMVQSLKQLFTEPITVSNEFKDGIPIYKVRIGQFDTWDEAQVFKNAIKSDFNMEGLIL
jgi:thiol-disulfide isomerase/thioredoxin